METGSCRLEIGTLFPRRRGRIKYNRQIVIQIKRISYGLITS
jgi:hypothetical protein